MRNTSTDEERAIPELEALKSDNSNPPSILDDKDSLFEKYLEDGAYMSDEEESPVKEAQRVSLSMNALKETTKFVKLFPGLQDETVYNSYSCAWEKEIPWQGKLYIAQQNIAFYSNIFGKKSVMSLAYSELLSVQKKNTMGLIQNSIKITTIENKNYTFTSFLKRDSAYNEIMEAWKNSKSQEISSEAKSPFLSSRQPKKRVSSNDALSVHTPPKWKGFAASMDARALVNKPLNISRMEEIVSFESIKSNSSLRVVTEISKAPLNITASEITPSSTEYDSRRDSEDVHFSISGDELQTNDGPRRPKSKHKNSNSNSVNDFFKRVFTPNSLNNSVVPSKIPKNAVVITPDSVISKELSQSTGPARCSCEAHYKLLGEETFNDSVDHAFKVLFLESALYKSAHDIRGTQGVEVGEWLEVECQSQREITFNALAKLPLLGKMVTPAIEKQCVIDKAVGKFYVIETSTKTPKVPSGDTFVTITRYCLVYQSKTSVKLSVSAKVDFIKKAAFWKDRIEAGAFEGAGEFVKELFSQYNESLGGEGIIPSPVSTETKELESIQSPKESYMPKKNHTKPASSPLLLIVVLLLTVGNILLGLHLNGKMNNLMQYMDLQNSEGMKKFSENHSHLSENILKNMEGVTAFISKVEKQFDVFSKQNEIKN